MEDKNNKPDNSQFRQQRLPAWQPVMSPPHVSACLAFLAIVFIPIGAAVIVANDGIVEKEYRYDDIMNCRIGSANAQAFNFTAGTAGWSQQGCQPDFNFTLDADIPGPVYMYYKLTNFYQNHRRYAKSRDTQQIAGKALGSGGASSDCDPILTPGSFWGKTDTVIATITTGTDVVSAKKYGDLQYSPCGLVAWSKFNDSFLLSSVDASTGRKTMLCDTARFYLNNGSKYIDGASQNMTCEKKGITWSSDYDKFVAPAVSASIWTGDRRWYSQAEADRFSSSDPYLTRGWYALEPGHAVPITTDEDFMVWMRTASLPTFRKLYRIFPKGLPRGRYNMFIREFFDSQQYGGEKYVVFSTVSWVGARNVFLGYAYIVVGSICALCAIGFFIVHKITGDRTQAAIDKLHELR
jgi:hypothetical protein